MRLNSIKLSGFKSFADAITLTLPGQLVGVVGPNGCGKSNIMDAVRWVLGESKASQLRGESMQDVIFNGTAERKPASRTLVELHFDNSDQRAGGAWGRFSEIAVRRVLTRDGASAYFINGQRVRRRDVHDVFMGTGLGPRAYAIIGQGTIGRIIESRPEELRLFLEEAAGVSKYKERRRETQNRLKDTRENLTRVEDILRELGSALAKLERQAAVADTYRQLQQSLTHKQQLLWFSRHQQGQAECQQLQSRLTEAELALQEAIAGLRAQETALETARQTHQGVADEVARAQSLLYETTAEVGQLEAQIRFVAEGRQRVQEQLNQLRGQQDDWQRRQAEAQDALQQLLQRQQQLQEELRAMDGHVADSVQRVARNQDAWLRAQAATQQASRQVSEVAQRRQIVAAEQRSVSEQLPQLQARRNRLQLARDELPSVDADALARLQAQLQEVQQAAAAAQQQLQVHQEQAQQLEAVRGAAQQRANEESARRADVAARLQALQELQQQVQARSALKPWRQKHGLDQVQPLWTQLTVEAGWERALEAALRERLAALPLDDMDRVVPLAADTPPARLAFYAVLPGRPGSAHDALPGLSRLVDRVRLHDANLHALLADWLTGCQTAPTLDVALQKREQLQPGAAIYTPEGHCVASTGVSFYAPDTEQAGLLARAREIEDMGKQLRAQQLLSEQAERELRQAQAACTTSAQQLTENRRQADALRAELHALQVEHLRLSQQAQQSAQRHEQIAGDLAELTVSETRLQQRQEQADQQITALQQQEQQARAALRQREQQEALARRELDGAREQHGVLKNQRQELDFERRGLEARRAELDRTLATAQQQQADLKVRLAAATTELEQLADDSAHASLQQALVRKLEREQALASRRSHYDDLSGQLRSLDEKRLALAQRLEPLRERSTELRLQQQAAALRVQELDQRLADAGADLPALAQAMERETADATQLQAQMERLQRRIENLGAVNLAALDELETERQRKSFLDAQSADLTEAMQTLEGAIAKIDAETRALLGQTFDAVNQHFGRMFPELFGGGHARLEMTGEEILDAGVQVMAQPPGKKNQTIHLLSGGEKALTAIALVFAIFQLNPAPFCLLDEVDAPLDDANTGRFARLVQAMSEQGTQFLFISHNKIAMEMAEQLIGVTMQEHGVSRIVAVDMQSAIRMTEAA